MGLLINIVFAWISVGLAFVLTIIWLLRIINKNIYYNKNNFLTKLNKILRKYHKSIGIILIITSLIHGYFSSRTILSINHGTILFSISLLLAATYMFKKELKNLKGWMNWHRVLTIAFIIFLVLHIVEEEGFVGIYAIKKSLSNTNISESQSDLVEDTNKNIIFSLIDDINGHNDSLINDDSSTTEDNADIDNKSATDIIYIDGTYTGTGIGFRPNLVVRIKVKDNLIESIEIIEHNEQKSSYYKPAFEQVPKQIIETQNTLVDIVSGSTYSSIGIMKAVEDALYKARE